MKAKYVALAAGLAMMGLNAQSAHAVQVNFRGGLVEALPCTISNGELIEVDFGDNLVIRNLDGVRYSKPLPYQIDCSGVGKVKLSLTGVPASFDNMAIQTSLPGLGIRILMEGGMPFPWQSSSFGDVDLQSLPQLTAVPVANSAQPPSPGAFTARATLLAEYQ